MSLRTRTVAALRRRLPELDDEAAWRGALAGAASLFMLLVAIAVLVPLRDRLDTGSLALVLLLPPLIATNGGRSLSMFLALISALTFNFLFTRPYYSFEIASSASIAAFFIYALIAVVLANYVGGFRSASAAAKRRARNMELLQSLAIDLIRCDDLRPALRRTLSDLRLVLGLRAAALRVSVRDQELDESVGTNVGAATAMLERVVGPSAERDLDTLSADGVQALAIRDSGITFGFLAVDTGHRRADSETVAVLESSCGILGLALGTGAPPARGSRAAGTQGHRPPADSAPRNPSRTTCAPRWRRSPQRPRRCASAYPPMRAAHCSATSSTKLGDSFDW